MIMYIAKFELQLLQNVSRYAAGGCGSPLPSAPVRNGRQELSCWAIFPTRTFMQNTSVSECDDEPRVKYDDDGGVSGGG